MFNTRPMYSVKCLLNEIGRLHIKHIRKLADCHQRRRYRTTFYAAQVRITYPGTTRKFALRDTLVFSMRIQNFPKRRFDKGAL